MSLVRTLPFFFVSPFVLSLPTMADSLPASAGDHVPTPVLHWTTCPASAEVPPTSTGFDCATAIVPIDYSKPTGGSFTLALIRHKATDPIHRIGSLFWNPGGPGASGVLNLPTAFQISPLVLFPEAVREDFDVISWDTRAVGAPDRFSTKPFVQCFDTIADEEKYESTLPAGTPSTPAEQRAWIEGYKFVAQKCASSASAYLLPHVSSTDSARDLDLLRRAVGDYQINYQGNSYGTLLGTTYANMFPDKVRAMMLIGNDPAPTYTNGGNPVAQVNTAYRQNVDVNGTKPTLNAFLNQCGEAPKANCPFSAGSPAATQQKWMTLLNRIQANPVVTDANVTYNYDRTVTYTVVLLYQPIAEWPILATMLEALWERNPNHNLYPPESTPAGQVTSQTLSILCAEQPNPRNPFAYFGLAQQAEQRSGAVGPYWTWQNEECAAWTAWASDWYTGPWNRQTANPVLLVNMINDPATPYSGAVMMEGVFAKARLLTVNGSGHADSGTPSICETNYVAQYFLKGTLPPEGTVCPQDEVPFAKPATAVSAK